MNERTNERTNKEALEGCGETSELYPLPWAVSGVQDPPHRAESRDIVSTEPEEGAWGRRWGFSHCQAPSPYPSKDVSPH